MNVPEILAAHPEPTPEDLAGPLPYLIHPPGKLSSTERWIAFRDKTLRPMMLMYPDDENLPKFLRQVEAVLARRAAIEHQVEQPMNIGRRALISMMGLFAGIGLTRLPETEFGNGEPPCPGCIAGDVDHRLSHTTKSFCYGRELTSYHFKPFCAVCAKPAKAKPDPEPWAWVPIAQARLRSLRS